MPKGYPKKKATRKKAPPGVSEELKAQKDGWERLAAQEREKQERDDFERSLASDAALAAAIQAHAVAVTKLAEAATKTTDAGVETAANAIRLMEEMSQGFGRAMGASEVEAAQIRAETEELRQQGEALEAEIRQKLEERGLLIDEPDDGDPH